MAKQDYDKILTRLMEILTRLSNGERLNVAELAEELGVTKRTIQKDFNQRLYRFPIITDGRGNYWFDEGYSLKERNLTTEELLVLTLSLDPLESSEHLAKIGEKLLKKLLASRRIENPLYIKSEPLQDIDLDAPLIHRLRSAIEENRTIRIFYSEREVMVEPYKIVSFDGIWYLYARECTTRRLKTWLLANIKEVELTPEYFNIDKKRIEAMLERTHTAWFEDGGDFDVVVRVMPEIAHYFKLKEFLDSQEILNEETDGSLIVKFDVTSDEDVDNLIKAWLPHIEILEPERLREKLTRELHDYLDMISRPRTRHAFDR
jgi:predicted DNA-binding transcriptional regulator YafY